MMKLFKKGILLALLCAAAAVALGSCSNESSDDGTETGSTGLTGSSIETKWITIPAGAYQMKVEILGIYYNERIYNVTLTKSCQMCDHEVTVLEWWTVMNCTDATTDFPYETWDHYAGLSDNEKGLNPVYNNLPVIASWYEAIKYCNALSAREGLTPAYTMTPTGGSNYDVSWNKSADGYRLPTAAEWQYAARAGETATDISVWSGTTDAGALGEYAWY
nr:SUMF1/EgtB/PvdO family nonheme iron enzyme [Treponema sp.]